MYHCDGVVVCRMAVKNPYEKFVNAAESVSDLSDEVRRHQDATQWAYNVVVCKISKS